MTDKYFAAQEDIRKLRAKLIAERREAIAWHLATGGRSPDETGQVDWQHLNKMIADLELIRVDEHRIESAQE